MSRFTSPQKDGKPPCKVIVFGLDGQDPAAVNALARRLSGTITRFYNTSRQNSDAGADGQWHSRMQLPAGQGLLSYSSNQGMETMTIRLNPRNVPELVEEEQEKKKLFEREPWDFLVLELEIPSSQMSDGRYVIQEMQAAARFYEPVLPDIIDPDNPPTMEDPDPPPLYTGLERFAVDEQQYNYKNSEPGRDPAYESGVYLMFAGAAQLEQIGDARIDNSEGVVRCSLLVDIREFDDKEIIEVDLWARLDPRQIKKSLIAVVTRASYDNDPVLSEVILYRSAGVATYLADKYPALLATVDTSLSTTSNPLNKFLPYPYTTGSITDAVLSDIDNFTYQDPTWFSNNFSSSRELFNAYSSTWQNPSPPAPDPPPWADGEWSQASFPVWEAANDAIAPGITTAMFPAPLDSLGYEYITVQPPKFYGTYDETFGIGDPGTPPPDIGFRFPLGGSGPLDSAAHVFYSTYTTYIFRASISTISTVGDTEFVTEQATLRGSAFRGAVIEPPESGPDEGRFMWSKQVPRAVQDVYDELAPGSTADFGQLEVSHLFPERPVFGLLADDIEIDNFVNADAPLAAEARYIGRVRFEQYKDDGTFTFIPVAELGPDELPEMPA